MIAFNTKNELGLSVEQHNKIDFFLYAVHELLHFLKVAKIRKFASRGTCNCTSPRTVDPSIH